jgi:phospholipid/cholesterol/gamma-HCH transport system permease protein
VTATQAEPATIAVGKSLDRSCAAQLLSDLERQFRARPQRLVLDLGEVATFDSAGLSTVVEGMRRAREQGVEVRLRGLSQPMLDFFSLVSIDRLAGKPPAPPARPGFVLRVGEFVEPKVDGLLGVLRTSADVLHAVFVGPFRGQRLRLDRTAMEIDQCAGGALPIILLIAFLLGLILAMQAWVQLRIFGCEIYVADMVGVSVMSEIGPLMTAIALAARSGSSNAAQLGSMVVGEEIDALKQMGIRPEGFLVVPKVLACAVSAIMLTVIFDVVGICGGALFAWGVADIEWLAFTAQLKQALHFSDFAFATGKSLTFGAIVGVVGCSLGLRVQGGSEGVGRATTNAVVLGIFLIIVVDAVFVAVQRLMLS